MYARVLTQPCCGSERLGAGGAREGAFARVRPPMVVALHLPSLHMGYGKKLWERSTTRGLLLRNYLYAAYLLCYAMIDNCFICAG